jgi:dihydrofolate synthase/folylpolyglutamate synthase
MTFIPPDPGPSRFQEAMRWLASFTDWEQMLHLAPARTTFDLGRLLRLLETLGNPHSGVPIAHITGTKGKTTSTYMVDAILRAHGLSTFRFISPHVERVQERLAVDGEDIPEVVFVEIADTLRPEIQRIRRERPDDLPSFFEMMTVMGFLWAKMSAVDALVLEVGLGGRLDATNVVDPAVSVITSVGLDHVRLLGGTREAIATEKAGILKPGRPAVLGLLPGDPAFGVISARAGDLGCPLTWPGHGFQLHRCRFEVRDDGGPKLVFDGEVSGLSFSGLTLRAGAAHQAVNALASIAAAEVILRKAGRPIEISRVRAALGALTVPARAEWFPGVPPILIDGAHTRESVNDLGEVAARLAVGRRIHLLCGLTRDRDPARVFSKIAGRVASVTATALRTPRTRPPEELLATFQALGIPATAEPDAGRALELALRAAGTDGMLLVTGSLYLAGSCRTILMRRRDPTAS